MTNDNDPDLVRKFLLMARAELAGRDLCRFIDAGDCFGQTGDPRALGDLAEISAWGALWRTGASMKICRNMAIELIMTLKMAQPPSRRSDAEEVRELLEQSLTDEVARRYLNSWNDAQDQTMANVQAVFDATLKRLDDALAVELEEKRGRLLR